MEKHPFGVFVPNNSEFLILGSFPPREFSQTQRPPKQAWFYGSPKNDFWKIMEKLYKTRLDLKKDKMNLLIRLKTAMADIISKCQRLNNNNSDQNLCGIAYNKEIIKILNNNPIKVIYFTSRFVEKGFYKICSGIINFKKQLTKNTTEIIVAPDNRNIKTVVLLSPSRSINRYIAGFEEYKKSGNKSFMDFKGKQYYKYLPKSTSRGVAQPG